MPFDTDALVNMIDTINREIAPLDLELKVGAFMVRLVDTTPTLLRRVENGVAGRLVAAKRQSATQDEGL
jgi:hypothetical protein